jgi:spore maturation protein CgeB
MPLNLPSSRYPGNIANNHGIQCKRAFYARHTMKILCAFGKYQYGDTGRGVGIEYEAFIPALQRLGHEVRHFETWDRSLYLTYAHLNHALLADVRKFHPEVIFTVQRDYEIWSETLTVIRRWGEAALVTWTTDDSFKFNSISKYIGRYYDAISTTYDYRVPDYKEAGIEGVYFTQWAANSHWLNPPMPADKCKHGVSFIGASYGARAAVVEKLKLAGIRVECFGFGWPNGSISTDEIPAVMRNSVISLNFSAGFRSDQGNANQIKARTFEVPGAGGFLLTDPAPGMGEVYNIGLEIEVFSNYVELERKIRYYLEHLDERDRVAQAGYLRTACEHTYEKRLEGLIRFALDRRILRLLSQREPAFAMDENAALTIPSPNLGWALSGLRWCVVKACSLVWGRQRGLNAARRLVFEASQTILGVRTFGAMSIPGRMFPYV